MPYQTILCETTGPTAVITLNRPQVLNAINAQMFDELEHAFTALATDESLRTILITGAGDKAFAAGADIRELAQTDQLSGIARRAHQVFAQIESCPKPVIACINGVAFGGGCELALACTLRLAADTARLGQPEAKLGLIPGFGGTQRLPRLIGRGAALKLILTAEFVLAAEALRLGLVDEVVPAAQLLPRAHEIAGSIAVLAPLAIQATLEVVRRGADLPLAEALALEAAAFDRLCNTEDKTEGIAAFLAKRPPIWRGK